MHVLFDARLLHRPLSGLERVQRNLIRELARRSEVDRLRVVVRAGTQLPADFPARAEAVPVHGTEGILAQLLAPDPADRPDVYHLSWFPDSSPRDLLLLPAASAAVVEVHDAILNRHPEYFDTEARWRWYHGFVKLLVARADRLLVHSASVAREVETDLGGDHGKCDVAPLAVDPSLLENVSETAVEAFRRQYGIRGDYFVALGKDYPHKDHPTLFRALARLDPAVHVVVAGDKIWHDGEDTDSLLRQLRLTDRVRFVRGLTDDEVKALLQGSRGLCYPSLEEGFGLPPIEAMLRGVPVLAARCMSIPEVCGDAAWLFDAGDDARLAELMQRALTDADAVAALVAKGRARAAEFSWERCVDRVLECYAAARAAAGADPRRQDDVGPLLENIVACPLDDSVELAALREQNVGLEAQLGALQERCDGYLADLQLLQAAAGVPVTETPPPVVAPRRPRWSLRRRLRKIRDALFQRPAPQ